MLDLHLIPSKDWGILPVIFKIGPVEISSYSFFVSLGVIVGAFVYYWLAKEQKKASENSFYVLLAGLLGGIIGAKLFSWLIHIDLLIQNYSDLTPFFIYGRTVTGGLIGGTLAVMYVKKRIKIKDKKGNMFAPAVAIGLAIGRIGCFLQGCCYGTPTKLPWGVNFGDGVLRHPTQIYESIYLFGVFIYLLIIRKKAKPGYLFYLFMNQYFIFRFFEEFIRPEKTYWGLTVIQYICVAAVVFVNVKYLYEQRRRK